MSVRSKARPIINISPLYSIAFTSTDDAAIFLDIRFKCDFAKDAEPFGGTSISIDPGSLRNVVEIADGSHSAILDLLQSQQKRRVRK